MRCVHDECLSGRVDMRSSDTARVWDRRMWEEDLCDDDDALIDSGNLTVRFGSWMGIRVEREKIQMRDWWLQGCWR